MSTTAGQPPPQITERDRIIFMVFLSLVFNLVVILGVGFDFNLPGSNPKTPTLDVVLVQKTDSQDPDEADYLAQHAQSGSGNTEEKIRPTTQSDAAPQPVPISGESDVLQAEQSPSTSTTEQPEVLTQYRAEQKIVSSDQVKPDPAQQHTSAELIASGREIARLEAEIAQSMEVYSKRLRHRRISANTKSFRDASYFESWQRKIERIGNLNYPEEARRRNVSGSLIMEVGINTDGTINEIVILRSSGQKLLDDAAIRIVRLASPFAPLTPAMRKDTDVLHITRTWRFRSGDGFSTSN